MEILAAYKLELQESHSGAQLPNTRQPTTLVKHFIFIQNVSLALLNMPRLSLEDSITFALSLPKFMVSLILASQS